MKKVTLGPDENKQKIPAVRGHLILCQRENSVKEIRDTSNGI